MQAAGGRWALGAGRARCRGAAGAEVRAGTQGAGRARAGRAGVGAAGARGPGRERAGRAAWACGAHGLGVGRVANAHLGVLNWARFGFCAL